VTTDVCILAASELPPGRRGLDPVDLHLLAVRNLLAEWDLAGVPLDGFFACPAGMADAAAPTDIFVYEAVIDHFGLRPRVAECLNSGGATYAVMVRRAVDAIRAGRCEAVLCVGAGTFPKVGAGAGDPMAAMVSHREYEAPYGGFIPAYYALAASRYLHETGATEEDLARVAVSQRRWARRHPHALMHDAPELTTADVLASRPIASPFKRFDCSIPTEGGGAFVVASGDVARRRRDATPAWILGSGEYHGFGCISQAPDLLDLGAARSGSEAYEEAGLGPADVDVVEIYDSFSINPLMFAEDLGFAARGEGPRLYREGRPDPGGSLPINTYGGLLSYGHTGDASGLSMLVEGALQAMGRAGERQVPDARRVLVHTYGGMTVEHATVILGSAP
jgi:acetyl-CoA acetyltransferase